MQPATCYCPLVSLGKHVLSGQLLLQLTGAFARKKKLLERIVQASKRYVDFRCDKSGLHISADHHVLAASLDSLVSCSYCNGGNVKVNEAICKSVNEALQKQLPRMMPWWHIKVKKETCIFLSRSESAVCMPTKSLWFCAVDACIFSSRAHFHKP